MTETQCIAGIYLDEKYQVRRRPEVEHEQQVAIYDLLEENHFEPVGDFTGPYAVHLRIEDNRLYFDVRGDDDSETLTTITLPLTPFRRIVKDYFMICESYYDAIKKSTPQQIETIDMARRGLHNEGAEQLRELLTEKVTIDENTARPAVYFGVRPSHSRLIPLMMDLPGAVLFACSFNAVRSVMAAALMQHFHGRSVFVDSCGVRAGDMDGFAIAAMDEFGLDISFHDPKTFDDLEDGCFDLIVTLSPEAQHRAVEMTRTMACDVVFWNTFDATIVEGSREQRLDAYRQVREQLKRKILAEFPVMGAPTV